MTFLNVKNKKTVSILIGLTFVMVGFQNCSKTEFEDASSEAPVAAKLEVVEEPDPDQFKCSTEVNASSTIVFDTPQPNAPATGSFVNSAGKKVSLTAQTIERMSNLISPRIEATAGRIDFAQNFVTTLAILNAKEVGQVGFFAAKEINIIARDIETVSNFAAGICISAQNIRTLQNLTGKVTLYGRNEGGVKAKLENPIRNVLSYMAVYDFEVPALEHQAVRAKFVNSHIGALSGGMGSILLINTDIDDVSRFAGTIRLRGTSKVGQVLNSKAKIIQE